MPTMTEDDSISRALLDSLAPAALSTFGSAILWFFASYFTAPNGAVSIGQAVPLRGPRNSLVLPIDIVSYRKDERLNVSFEVDPPVPLQSITSSRPVDLIASPDSKASGKQILRVTGIPGEARTRIFVETKLIAQVPYVTVRNSEEAGLVIDRDLTLESRNARIAKALPQMLLIFSLVSYVSFFCAEKLFLQPVRKKLSESMNRAQDLQANLNELKAKTEEAMLQIGNTDDHLKEVKRKEQEDRAKMRYLLLSRISDLKKELEFWRDTLRSHVVHQGGKREGADAIIRLISSRLQTWSTQSSQQDIETIDVVTNLLRKTP